MHHKQGGVVMSIHSYPGVEGASLVVLKQVLVKELTASGEFVLQITHRRLNDRKCSPKEVLEEFPAYIRTVPSIT